MGSLILLAGECVVDRCVVDRPGRDC